MVQTDLVDDELPGLHSEMARERALEADRDVAEADGAVPGIEQRARDDPDRIREVDDPGSRRRELPYPVRDRQHHRHRPESLREPAGAGRLLADAAARERDGLVREARLLAADANLDQDEVGAVERAIQVAGHLQLAGIALALQHPRGKPADHVAPLLVDVVQDELAYVDLVALPRESRHELRRIGRATADDRDLHPLTPVRVTPSTNARCARKKRTSTGSITRIVAAITRFHCT